MITSDVYDSVYGSTERIAQAIGDALAGEVRVLRVGEADVSELKPLDHLLAGSPAHGGGHQNPCETS